MPNEDYIKRSDAVFAFCGACKWIEVCGQLGEPCEEVKRIKAIPADDVEPVRHGRWIPGDRFEYDGHGETVRHPGGITCSQCRYSFAEKYLWSRSYCPHCGAKMDKETDKKEETVNEITPEMIEAAERNEKRIKERVDRIYDELIAEKRAEIERLEAEIAKMPPLDYKKLSANPPKPPKEADA